MPPVGEPELVVNSHERHISASFIIRPHMPATASADNMELLMDQPYWYVSRVIVKQPYRKMGLGKRLVRALQTAMINQGGKVLVDPGGYDIPHEEQVTFYKKCGFVEHLKIEGRLVWEAEVVLKSRVGEDDETYIVCGCDHKYTADAYGTNTVGRPIKDSVLVYVPQCPNCNRIPKWETTPKLEVGP